MFISSVMESKLELLLASVWCLCGANGWERGIFLSLCFHSEDKKPIFCGSAGRNKDVGEIGGSWKDAQILTTDKIIWVAASLPIWR